MQQSEQRESVQSQGQRAMWSGQDMEIFRSRLISAFQDVPSAAPLADATIVLEALSGWPAH